MSKPGIGDRVTTRVLTAIDGSAVPLPDPDAVRAIAKGASIKGGVTAKEDHFSKAGSA